MFCALIVGLTSCASKEKASDTPTTETDRVEVIYFHGKQRCATCKAIENHTAEVVNSTFADELQNGTLIFKIVDISTPEGELIADNYEVTWSSLFVNKWKDGKEMRTDMTEFGFANARNNPEVFKTELAKQISKSLK